MHLVRYQVAVSIDGFIAPKDGSADWLSPYGKVAGEFMGPWMKQIGGVIVGRTSYDQSGGMMSKAPTLLMTSRPLAKAPKSVIVAANAAEGLAQLKSRIHSESGAGSDIWLFGGGVTAGRFLREGLIDLIEVAVAPVVLGEGKPLFADGPLQLTFEHTGTQPLGDGCVLNTYRKIAATPRRPAQARRWRSR
jgi:dihydrofolate reductase